MENKYPSPETIVRRDLDNGITILAFENSSSETVVIDGLIRAGALGESRANAGLAGFVATLLMRGTKFRSYGTIYDLLEGCGATLQFGGGRHTTSFSGHCLVEDFDSVLEIWAQSLRWPNFPDEQVERVRGQMMTSLQIRADDTRQQAALIFRESLYKNHPYGISVRGYNDSISRISRQDLVDRHNSSFGPGKMIVTVVGSLNAEEVVAKIESHLGDWFNPNQTGIPPVPDAKQPDQSLRRDVVLPGKSQTDIILGLPGPRRSAPDYLQASMANTILGVFGMMGRIGRRLREDEGLAYYAYSTLHGGIGPSAWSASAGVAPANVEPAIMLLLDEIEKLTNGPVTEEELEDSKAFRTGSLPVSLETNAGLANIITDMEFYELGLDYLQRFPDLINSISAEGIRQAATNYLDIERIVIATAGPGANE